MKLRTRLFALVILILIPMVGIEIYDEMDLRARRAAEGRDEALRMVRLIASEQSRFMEGARQLLTALGETPAVRSGDSVSCSAFLANLVRSFPPYVSLLSTDRLGHPACVSGAAETTGFFGNKAAFRLAIARGGFAVGEYSFDKLSRQEVLYVAQPYFDAAGRIGGVVAAGLSLQWLNQEIDRSPVPPHATISVVDRTGMILARRPDQKNFVGTRISGQVHSYLLSGQEGVHEAPGFDGITRIYAYAPLPSGPSGLTVSVGLDKDELLKGIQAENRRDILVISGSAVLALLLASVGARSFISRPLRTLLDAAEHWRQGDLGTRVLVPETRSEFGRLGARFNAMAAAIGAREQELERRVQERTAALGEAMQAQRAAEAALFESQKMETIGRLTGGIAHDFNNLLAAIVGNIELARSRLGPSHPGLPRLAAAIQSANRGAGLVQQLLAFARRQNLRPAVVDLNRHLTGSLDMLQRLLRTNVRVETALSPETWLVRVDPNQLEAAILNLAINARDAMPQGGTVRVSTKNVRLPHEPNQIELAGDFVALAVADTGSGIAPEILDKVFEPFFTTKQVGEGSGLGLSMVQGFARQSAGAVCIESQLGRGTCVTLYLPRTREALHRPPPSEAALAGAGNILLVEDDPEIRSVTGQLLEVIGYTVTTVADAMEAMRFLRQTDNRIDLLITDFEPTAGLSGIQLIDRIRNDRPKLPALLIIGSSHHFSDPSETSRIQVLAKPFDRAALAQAVKRALQTGAARVPDPDADRPGSVAPGSAAPGSAAPGSAAPESGAPESAGMDRTHAP